jgi:hypothetical protein
MNARFKNVLLSIALLASTQCALATCPPPGFHFVYVGNKTLHPTTCQYETPQQAIEAAICPGFNIVLTNEVAYTGQAISVANKSVSLVGSTSACGVQPLLADADGGGAPPVRVTLDATGNGNLPAIAVTGSANLSLANLRITGGTNANSYGGGIDFEANGTLALTNVSVDGNSASFGGGIGVLPASGHAEITLGPYTTIINNQGSQRGGGIALEGDSHLLMTAAHTSIASNMATYLFQGTGYGGGLSLVGPARADIGSPGDGYDAAFHDNTAAYGAAISALRSSDRAVVTLFTTDPAHPVRIENNASAYQGGALYQIGSAVCLFDALIKGNSTQRINGNLGSGTVAYSEGGSLSINADSSGFCNHERLIALGATHCEPLESCNLALLNRGGPLFEISGGSLTLDRFSIREGNDASAAFESYGNVFLHNCVIAENHFVTMATIASTLTLDSCTVTQNTIDSNFLFNRMSVYSGSIPVILSNSIVSENPVYQLHDTHTNEVLVQASYALLSDTSTVSSGIGYFSDDPHFVSLAGDYRLRENSPAIDRAPATAQDSGDLDLQPRSVDIAGVIDQPGPRDLGAYEYQVDGVGDRIFLGTFE